MSKNWFAFRIFVIAANVLALTSIPVEQSNIDWGACVLISALSAVAVYMWLTAVRTRGGIDWSEPYSWRKPFFPMQRYPTRFWVLASYALMISGSSAVIKDVVLHQEKTAVGGTFFFMGLAIFGSLLLRMRDHMGPGKG